MPPLITAVRLQRLTTADRRLLDGVSLTLEPGERLGIAGPSGSGKTLLLRALALLDPLQGGEVRWRGEAVQDREVPAYRGRVGYLRQQPALAEGTVEANLRLPFSLRRHAGRRFDRREALERLAGAGRDPAFAGRSTRDLSGGEAQVVALVRMLLVRPQVLLLDEPTAALDPEATAGVERMVQQWWLGGDGRAFIWVAHSASQLQRVAGRTLTMRDGRLEEEA